MTALADYLRDRMAQVGVDSARGLAARVGIAPQTAVRLLGGVGTPSEATLRLIADRLPAPLPRLRRLAGLPGGDLGPFRLPDWADQLTGPQRDVVVGVARALLDASTTSPEQPNAGNGP